MLLGFDSYQGAFVDFCYSGDLAAGLFYAPEK